jgi:uroporphyrinogen-III synthase
MSSLPLAGRRILVTRAAHQASKLSDALRALGAEPVEVPVLEIQPPESYEPFDDALRHLDRFDWLILTSTNSLQQLSLRCQRFGVNPAKAEGLNVAAVGRATAEAARHFGLHVDIVPETYVAESLVAALAPRIAGKKVLLARAAVARDVIPDALRAAGARVDVVDAYRNILPESAPEQLRAALAKPIDAATFTSSSSVTHLAEAAEQAEIAFPLPGVRAVSIGPMTSQTLRKNGWAPAIEANPHDIAGLVSATVHILDA